MLIDEIIKLNIEDKTGGSKFTGFSACAMAVYHKAFTGNFKKYSSLKALREDFSTSDSIYKSASVFFGQSRIPNELTLMKLPMDINTVVLKVDRVVVGDYVISVNGTDVTFTASSSHTTTTLATAIKTAIASVSGVSATSRGDNITITADTVKTKNPNLSFSYTVPTTSTSLVSYLSGIGSFPPYFVFNGQELTFDKHKAISDWVEGKTKVYILGALNSSLLVDLTKNKTTDTGAGSLAYVLGRTNSRKRTVLVTHSTIYLPSALCGLITTYAVGGYNPDFRKLSITGDELTETQRSNAKEKNIGHYIDSGLGDVTQNIKAINYSNPNRYLDIIQNIDWLSITIKEKLFYLISNTLALPYSDEGIELVKTEVLNVFSEGERIGVLTPDFGHTVTIPPIKDISQLDRSNRHIPRVNIQARILGKINSFTINLVVSI